MSLYTRARKHIDMNRVKELREEKIKREKIAEILRQQEEIRAELAEIEAEESKYINWRQELEEGMTTAGMGMVNYQAGGDTNLETALGSVSLNANNVDSGENAQVTSSVFDTTKYDTIKFTVTQLTSGTQALRLFGNYGSDPNIFYIMTNDLKANPVVSLSGAQKSNFRFQVRSFNDDPGNMATYRVSASFQRRTPINVLVPLDDPDASAFIRDGDFDRLSNEEKKKKLEEQLRSSDEYLKNKFGEGMPKSATISDVQPQQSFSDIAQGLPYTDEDDAFDDPYYKGPPPDLDDDSDFDPDDFEYASADWPTGDPSQKPQPPVQAPWNRWPTVPGGRPFPYPPGGGGSGEKYPLARKRNTVVAHHEPEGEVLSEKKRLKSFKSLIDKIPGYYDGKPSPLGFPVEEPPKMKNGYHPDLVDGKKVANRFNRLDPQSAKAMPKTGNPHIDKKVRAAAKKPK